MKRTLLILLLLIAASAFGVNVTDFTVTPGDGRVVLRWEASDEGGLSRYVLERAIDGGTFAEVGSIAPRGIHQTYQFIDTDLFSLDRLPRQFSYRLKYVMRDGTVSYSVTRETTILISSIRKTWGSIKAMFR